MEDLRRQINDLVQKIDRHRELLTRYEMEKRQLMIEIDRVRRTQIQRVPLSAAQIAAHDRTARQRLNYLRGGYQQRAPAYSSRYADEGVAEYDADEM
jgi:hypothetical protein